MGDTLRRVDIAHATAASETWSVDGAYTAFEGRVFPVGARGQRVVNEWSVQTLWGLDERTQAQSFLQLLRDVAQETDARLDVHIEQYNGTTVDFVGETHEVPRGLSTNSTEISVVFRQVDV